MSASLQPYISNVKALLQAMGQSRTLTGPEVDLCVACHDNGVEAAVPTQMIADARDAALLDRRLREAAAKRRPWWRRWFSR